MKCYIASSFRNARLNQEIADYLERRGYAVYLPQRDTPQDRDIREIHDKNVKAIEDADFVLHVTDSGKAAAYEAGYAAAKEKPVILFNNSAGEDLSRKMELIKSVMTLTSLEELLLIEGLFAAGG